MKRYVATVIVMLAAPFLTSGLVYAASKTVSVNVIDPTGVGKEIGTLRLSDTEAGFANHSGSRRSATGRSRFPFECQSELRPRQRAGWAASGGHGGGRPLRPSRHGQTPRAARRWAQGRPARVDG
jgi:hypothetical protein